jgi:GxxExxY protein
MNTREINELIIGSSYRIYNKMGFGFPESVYRNCLLLELQKMDLQTEAQHPIKTYYEGQLVGKFIADILVENEIIVQIKSVNKIMPVNEQQLVSYLAATQVQTGLIINFGENKIDIIYKHREKPSQTSLFVGSFLKPVNA